MTYLVLKYDMRAPAFGTPKEALYQAAIEQSAWADQKGFGTLMLAEHHGTEDGYLPAPVVLSAAIAARTQHIRLRVQALILPFHDPIRLAEDLAIVDIISNGRAEATVAGGYVAREFVMFGQQLKKRPSLIADGVATLKQAWSGEPFSYRGRSVTVTPTPVQDPHPPLLMGGASEAAAKRAARIADGFIPAMPGLYDVYKTECETLGRPAAKEERMGPVFLHIAEDPERAWEQIAPHALHETNSYGKWMAESMGDQAVYSKSNDVEVLRASGAYQVVTPQQCIEIARA
ncbi:MAG: LLM class flavin-dependent oxidoreductase, partial [Pseudomonadales bacterium]